MLRRVTHSSKRRPRRVKWNWHRPLEDLLSSSHLWHGFACLGRDVWLRGGGFASGDPHPAQHQSSAGRWKLRRLGDRRPLPCSDALPVAVLPDQALLSKAHLLALASRPFLRP